MRKKYFFTSLLALCLSWAGYAQKVSYSLAMSEPHTHYFEVKVQVEGIRKNSSYVDFKMPVWAPGSYLIREFARHVEAEDAQTPNGKPLKWEKINKNTWRVYTDKTTDAAVFSYKVYAYELSVRTSFLDDTHAYINGTSMFVFPIGYQNLPLTLSIKPYKEWQNISTGLTPTTDQWTLSANNYDILADSPIEIGNHKVLEFTSNAIPHRIALYGKANYDEKQITKDLKKIADEATKVFGENPCQNYTFIVHNASFSGGGLEHANSTTLLVERQRYDTPSGYFSFISLAAHEYFHLWNVKRLRPTPLGPFDYDNENYTRQLWIAEGFTDYYDNLIPRRAGFSTENAFLNTMTDMISQHENSTGCRVQSLTEARFDAWIKSYRPNENSGNTTISYYGSGARVAAMLDLLILHNSDGTKNLDNVMRYMYNEYYKKLNRPYTEDEFRKGLELIAGEPLAEFLQRHVYGKETINYNRFLNYAGLQLIEEKDDEVGLGARLEDRAGKIIVTFTKRGGVAYEQGLNVNDEVLGVDGLRLSVGLLNQYIARKKPNEKISLLISRDGLIRTLELTLKTMDNTAYTIERVANPSEKQRKIYERWIGSKPINE